MSDLGGKWNFVSLGNTVALARFKSRSNCRVQESETRWAGVSLILCAFILCVDELRRGVGLAAERSIQSAAMAVESS